ncbi:hypothetical protein BJ508DRAFT_332810 [Ascobolus immersus RN42]|uniref:Uncharacterized protein n=1 Tax=Ascobolus immersus RN42 TaxID=1160509 RepID=A0A3N4HNY1_ASCIM|nr:hypothetical protein BJ508DRAFT_332810 [Ascobolus immersus RN42]
MADNSRLEGDPMLHSSSTQSAPYSADSPMNLQTVTNQNQLMPVYSNRSPHISSETEGSEHHLLPRDSPMQHTITPRRTFLEPVEQPVYPAGTILRLPNGTGMTVMAPFTIRLATPLFLDRSQNPLPCGTILMAPPTFDHWFISSAFYLYLAAPLQSGLGSSLPPPQGLSLPGFVPSPQHLQPRHSRHQVPQVLPQQQQHLPSPQHHAEQLQTLPPIQHHALPRSQEGGGTSHLEVSLLLNEIEPERLYSGFLAIPEFDNQPAVIPQGSFPPRLNTPALAPNHRRKWAPVEFSQDKPRPVLVLAKNSETGTFHFMFGSQTPRVPEHYLPFHHEVDQNGRPKLKVLLDPPAPLDQVGYLCGSHVIEGHPVPVRGYYNVKEGGIRIPPVSGSRRCTKVLNAKALSDWNLAFWFEVQRLEAEKRKLFESGQEKRGSGGSGMLGGGNACGHQSGAASEGGGANQDGSERKGEKEASRGEKSSGSDQNSGFVSRAGGTLVSGAVTAVEDVGAVDPSESSTAGDGVASGGWTQEEWADLWDYASEEEDMNHEQQAQPEPVVVKEWEDLLEVDVYGPRQPVFLVLFPYNDDHYAKSDPPAPFAASTLSPLAAPFFPCTPSVSHASNDIEMDDASSDAPSSFDAPTRPSRSTEPTPNPALDFGISAPYGIRSPPEVTQAPLASSSSSLFHSADLPRTSLFSISPKE